MRDLIDYVTKNSVVVDRSSKECQKDMIFVGINKSEEADKEKLIDLIKSSKGQFCEVDLFDKKEHNYLEIGGWIGDQGMALKLMGLGACLGLWRLLTPKTMLGSMCDEEMANRMAGIGMVAIQSE